MKVYGQSGSEPRAAQCISRHIITRYDTCNTENSFQDIVKQQESLFTSTIGIFVKDDDKKSRNAAQVLHVIKLQKLPSVSYMRYDEGTLCIDHIAPEDLNMASTD